MTDRIRFTPDLHFLKLTLLCCFAWGAGQALAAAPAAPAADLPSLKQAYQPHFLIGVAVNPGNYADPESVEARLVAKHFNVLTAENAMKWDAIQPAPGRFDFREADRLVEFARSNNLQVVGHTLVWHSQTPAWVFNDDQGRPLGREALLARMREHISTVVGRYAGRVQAWDVVNEALNDNGTLRNSKWREIIGDDYIRKAFEYAREADPAAHLYYNDYRLEHAPKRGGAVALVKKLQAEGVRVDGVGSQSHVGLAGPSLAEIEASIRDFAAIGVKVMITELDVDVLPTTRDWGDADVQRREAEDPAFNPYAGGLPDDIQQKLAQRYADIFRVYLENHDDIGRVTFWGLSDRHTWLNNFPIRGRTNHPLLFDRDNQPKPAFHAVIEEARKASANRAETGTPAP